MDLEGTYTVENSVIIPIFIMLFLSVISITGYYHDRIIAKGAVELAAVKLEKMSVEEREVEMNTLKQQLGDYIVRKALFLKNVLIDTEEKTYTYKVICTAKYPFKLLNTGLGELSIDAEIARHNPCNKIRMVEAAMEVFTK